MKKSAGILPFKKEKDNYYVLLAHFGGPYRENLDKGAWSIPKGETNKNESIIDAAKREFFEETNINLTNEIKYLASKKISNKKLVIIFTSYYDGSIEDFKSNEFELEWPKNSGNIKKFHEMDKIRWFTIEEAKKYIIKNQLFFIERFEEVLKDIMKEVN